MHACAARKVWEEQEGEILRERKERDNSLSLLLLLCLFRLYELLHALHLLLKFGQQLIRAPILVHQTGPRIRLVALALVLAPARHQILPPDVRLDAKDRMLRVPFDQLIIMDQYLAEGSAFLKALKFFEQLRVQQAITECTIVADAITECMIFADM